MHSKGKKPKKSIYFECRMHIMQQVKDLDMSFNSMLTVLSNFLSVAEAAASLLNFPNSSHFSFTVASTLRSSPKRCKKDVIAKQT